MVCYLCIENQKCQNSISKFIFSRLVVEVVMHHMAFIPLDDLVVEGKALADYMP